MNRRLKSVLCIALVVCYAAGLALMLMDMLPIAIGVWTIWLVGGIAVLVSEHLRKKKESGDESK